MLPLLHGSAQECVQAREQNSKHTLLLVNGLLSLVASLRGLGCVCGLLAQMVVVVDDENRENEGDLIMAGALVTPESMAFIVKHTSGLVCAAAAPHILDRLEIPLMVNSSQNEDAMRTAFTVSVVSLTSLCRGRSILTRLLRQHGDLEPGRGRCVWHCLHHACCKCVHCIFQWQESLVSLLLAGRTR